MSNKIFKISGNFFQYGEWAEPDPAFVGEIVLEDSGTFYGYCNELYDDNMPDLNKNRFIAGAITANARNHKLGIAFYKLSNDEVQLPLMYVVPDLEDSTNGEWAILSNFSGYFQRVDRAKIQLEELIFSNPEAESERIRDRFEDLDRNINGNGQLIDQIQCCINILVNAV